MYMGGGKIPQQQIQEGKRRYLQEQAKKENIRKKTEIAREVLNYFPVIGTIEDAYEAYLKPTWYNTLFAGLSAVGDFYPGAKPLKLGKTFMGTKVAEKIFKYAKDRNNPLYQYLIGIIPDATTNTVQNVVND